ncbi:SDR family oxidoreductase [Synechococcus sp. PCC 7336]|uniref:SDR family oxidoreductase n=1 Tax=Synechococcus sp. PCC 7336 TaxID=195250 RepID=UPI0003817C19|nr:SDR family oxidoreductase [Synechococcus sp. PCC 7336]
MSKVVMVTGASAGIGQATAAAFARRGYRLAIAARTAAPLKEVAIALEKDFNAEVLAIPTDVTDPEQVRQLVEATRDRYGAIDILVNNAGICASGPFAEMSLEQLQQLMEVNFWGYVHTIQAVLPHMLQQNNGQIVNVGSFGGKMPLPRMAAYCASKYAVTGLTETLRLELEPQGIQIIGVHPGVVNTSFLERAIFVGDAASSNGGSARQQMEATLDSMVAQQPEEIAEAIVRASTTGQKDVVVGPLQVATAAYQLLPGIVGPLMSRLPRNR